MTGFKTTRELTKLANEVSEELGFVFTEFTDDQVKPYGAIPDEYVASWIASMLNVTTNPQDFSNLEDLIEDSMLRLK